MVITSTADTSGCLSVAPAPTTIEGSYQRQTHPLVEHKLLAAPTKQGTNVVAGRRQFPVIRPIAASRHLKLPSRPVLDEDPNPATHNKWVAVALAVLFGYLGAHLFYLGYRHRGFGYMAVTLLCVGLIALLLAALPVASLSTGLTILLLALIGIVLIGIVYVYALVDALRILFKGTDALG